MKSIGNSATWNSIILAIVASFLFTWRDEASSLHGYLDLFGFAFITKVVSTIITLTLSNLYLAKQSFRPDDSLTREGEPDSKEVQDRVKNAEKIRNLLGLDNKE